VKEGKYVVAIFILSELVSLISITNIRVIIDIDIQRTVRCSTGCIHKGQEVKEEVKFILEAY
jgi:hypothetical protein